MGYEWWQTALTGEKVGGPNLPVHDDEAHAGFYRMRTSKGGPFKPVAIWEEDGKLVALVDGQQADPGAIWTHCCRHSILEEWYRARMIGQPWPDESAHVTASLAHDTSTNNPPTDEAEIIQGQIEAASAGVAEYADIKDDETAAKAQSLRSRLLELSGTADKRREALVRPHLDAQKSVNEKWQPLVKAAKAAADTIRAALGAHETRKAQEAERVRKAAEEARIKAEREAVKAAAKGKPVPPPPPPPEPVPAPAATIRGAYGRAAGVKVVKVAKVIDQDAAYGALKAHPEMIALIAALAQRAATAGIPLAGVEVTEERKVS